MNTYIVYNLRNPHVTIMCRTQASEDDALYEMQRNFPAYQLNSVKVKKS